MTMMPEGATGLSARPSLLSYESVGPVEQPEAILNYQTYFSNELLTHLPLVLLGVPEAFCGGTL